MSFAPANSRGIFLNARLAVNGIQCAARSFGTLTAGRAGLLSGMVGSPGSGAGIGRTLTASGRVRAICTHAISFGSLAKPTTLPIIAGQSGGFGASGARLAALRLGWYH